MKIQNILVSGLTAGDKGSSGYRDPEDGSGTGKDDGLLLGWLSSGSYFLDTIVLQGANSSNALIGAVTQSDETNATPLVQFWRVNFGTALNNGNETLSSGFIENFAAGQAYYYYSSLDGDGYMISVPDADQGTRDENGYKKIIKGIVQTEVPLAGRGDGVFYINPILDGLTEGYGTAESPYLISSARQLYAVAYALNTWNQENLLQLLYNVTMLPEGLEQTDQSGGSVVYYAIREGVLQEGYTAEKVLEHLRTAYYRLSENIDMSLINPTGWDSVNQSEGTVYIGIGTYQHPFAGDFNGRGYSIVLKDHGLLGYVDGANVSNLTLAADENGINLAENDQKNGVGAGSGQKDRYFGLVADVILGNDNYFTNLTVGGKVIVGDATDLYFGGYVGYIEAGTLILNSVPNQYDATLALYRDKDNLIRYQGTELEFRYASVCPLLRDGYIIYEGGESQQYILTGFNAPEARVNEEYEPV